MHPIDPVQLSRTAFFAKLLTKPLIKSNVLSGAVGFLIFSIPETYDVVTNRISGAQYATNLTVFSTSVIGGSLGAVAGNYLAVIISNSLRCKSMKLVSAGKVIGCLAIGTIVGIGVSKIINVFFEGDEPRNKRLFDAVARSMVQEYLLDDYETHLLVEKLKHISSLKMSNFLKTLHSSKEQVITISNFLKPYFDSIIEKREAVVLKLDYSFK